MEKSAQLEQRDILPAGIGRPDTIVRAILERAADTRPGEVAVVWPDGSQWTYADALRRAYSAANALRRSGVGPGDRVAILLPNGPGFLSAWWGVGTLGATVVPVNTSFRGRSLAELIALSEPAALITDSGLAPRVDALEPAIRRPPSIDVELLLSDDDASRPELARPIFWGDTECLVLTSGTTGPSRLVETTHLHNFLGGAHFIYGVGATDRDTVLCDLPMFHSAALYMITAALNVGARLAVRDRPAMSHYWEAARDSGATIAMMVSSMTAFLEEQAPRPAEHEHHIRAILSAPLPADPQRFLRRFGIAQMRTAYGSTETPGALISDSQDELIAGYCGRQRAGFECRIVDATDTEVPPDTAGELVMRSSEPWALTPQYFRNPEATATAWRNGWFHTGDMFRADADGRFYFVDRMKDALRRRGENVSSAEVEIDVQSHPGVAEAACVAYRGAGMTDDEVKVWVVPVEGEAVDCAELFLYCADRMPHFMVPRYIEVIAELPRSPGGKIRKFELRQLGNSERTWDSEAAGLRATRNGVQTGWAHV